MITTFTYDRANRLRTADAGGVITTYTHDAAGNRTRCQSPADLTDYAYDAAGRMAVAEPVAGPVTLTYNADGQRVAKRSTDGSVTGFLYDEKKLLHETDDVGGDVTATFTSTADQEYGDLIDEDGHEHVTHQFDAQACTNALLDPQGNVQARYKYYAFGRVAGVSVEGEAWSTLSVPAWWTMGVDAWATLPLVSTQLGTAGQKQYYLDPETQLYLLGMGNDDPTPAPAVARHAGGRYYDPDTARFLSEDPTRQAAGDPNLYRYVHNSPVDRLDPSGHETREEKEKRERQAEAPRQATQKNQGNDNEDADRMSVDSTAQSGASSSPTYRQRLRLIGLSQKQVLQIIGGGQLTMERYVQLAEMAMGGAGLPAGWDNPYGSTIPEGDGKERALTLKDNSMQSAPAGLTLEEYNVFIAFRTMHPELGPLMSSVGSAGTLNRAAETGTNFTASGEPLQNSIINQAAIGAAAGKFPKLLSGGRSITPAANSSATPARGPILSAEGPQPPLSAAKPSVLGEVEGTPPPSARAPQGNIPSESSRAFSPIAESTPSSTRVPNVITRDQIGEGGMKKVYNVAGDDSLVVATEKPPPGGTTNPQSFARRAQAEIDALRLLEENGLPVVRTKGVVDVNSEEPGILMEKVPGAQNSKDAVAVVGKDVRVVGNGKVSNLNEQSIVNLEMIRTTMITKKIKVDDMQFLVDENGHVKFSDPALVQDKTPPNRKNLDMIKLLIEQAKKNIDFKEEGSNR